MLRRWLASWRRGDAALWLSFGVLIVSAALASAQFANPSGGVDRGYGAREGDLMSHGVDPATTSGAFSGIDRGETEAAAAKRGRESAKSAGLQPEVKSGLKAERFPSPEAAASAFIAALREGNRARLQSIFGAQEELVSSGDEVSDRALIARFLKEYDTRHTLDGVEARMITLTVGASAWPFAVPIVQDDEGFYFNATAGANEVVFRRIGRNELATIEVCRGYVASQEEYAATGHDGEPAGVYAQALMSDRGRHNGLYWPAPADGLRSPAGPLLAAAAAEGYSTETAGRSAPYHGYFYKPLREQGRNARGGAKKYIGSDGKQRGGFALVAYPAYYGRSGVKSFIVNQDGKVFEKDLGSGTIETVRELHEFDPQGWSPVL
jgi:DUF2950 family protein